MKKIPCAWLFGPRSLLVAIEHVYGQPLPFKAPGRTPKDFHNREIQPCRPRTCKTASAAKRPLCNVRSIAAARGFPRAEHVIEGIHTALSLIMFAMPCSAIGMLAMFAIRSPFSTSALRLRMCLMSATVWSVLTVLS